ncbi:MAG: hypothetical protein M1297_06165 [Nitrospirae bacterium]|jgi:DNA polymerase-3 subunit delta'|nr:hypothetical protein [Nitrospirota bacterium]
MITEGFLSPGEHQLPDILRQLLRTSRTSSIPATYLFHGPKGLGKKETALAWSRYLLCIRPDHPDSSPCLSCTQFRKLRPDGSVHHPDVLFLSPGEGVSIPIDETRRFISELSSAPLLGNRRAGIVVDAHALTESAANSLLKTLEDPPDKTVIILVTPYPDSLLPTLLSRTLSITFPARSREEMESCLENLAGDNLSPAEKDMLLLFSRGAPGQIKPLRESAQWSLFDKLPRLLTRPKKGTLFDMETLPLLSDPSGFSLLLDALESLLLDLYRLDVSKDARTSVPVPSGLADALSHLKREEFHDRVLKLRTLTIHNINRSLAVEELLWDWNETLASGNDETSKSV